MAKTPDSTSKESFVEETRQPADLEKDASAGAAYIVGEDIDADTEGLKTTKNGKIILIPQPSSDPDDPLNWSWMKKHTVLLALLLPSLLTDWGMTWGTTLFELQAVTWKMSVPAAARSVSGGIFLQGPGGVLAVPFVQRFGRLPVLFWSQALALIMIIAATFSPSYASFTAFRALQGFFGTAPQVIGLTMIHDMFFFHQHAVKINIWAFCFVIGPYVGPFISSWLLIKLGWEADMGVLAGFYGFSTCLVIILGKETLYDRENNRVPTAGASRISLLTGVAGVKATGMPKMMDVFKHLFELLICPQLLLPCLFVCIQFMWAIGIVTTITQFIKPPPYSLNNTDASLFYLAPIVGSIVGELWGHWFNDWLCNRYIRTHNGKYEPENRLWGAYPGAALALCSLVLYGQTLQHTLPVVGLAAAWAIMAFAQVSSTTAISAYALDCFPHHAALASSWINFWRTTGGFCVTYFQTQWVAKSGAAVTFGVQGAIVGAFTFFVVATQIWGKKWRANHAPPAAEN